MTRAGINANPGGAKQRDWYPAPALLPGEKEMEQGVGGEGGERGGSFVKGISIHTAKYQGNKFQKTGAGSLAMCLWVWVCSSLWVVAVFTGWMVDKAFKELSASGASSSSSVKAACPAHKSGLPTLSSILSQEQKKAM